MSEDGVSYKCNRCNVETVSEPCDKYARCKSCSVEDRAKSLEIVHGGIASLIEEDKAPGGKKKDKPNNKTKLMKPESWKEEITKLMDIPEKEDNNTASGTVAELADTTPSKRGKRGKYKKRPGGIGCDCKKHIIIEDTQIGNTPIEESKEYEISDGIKRFRKVEKLVRVFDEVREESLSDKMDGLSIIKMAILIVYPDWIE